MLIRSQDKEKIIVLENIKCIECNHIFTEDSRSFRNSKYENTDIDADCDSLGNYSSQEKAIEVLDMIEKNYRESFNPLINKGLNSVFEMPEDDEVII